MPGPERSENAQAPPAQGQAGAAIARQRAPGAAAPPSSDPQALPLAIVALSLDGRCRERNPADRAIFGDAAERFLERFTDRAAGQALLAAVTTEGAAEGLERLRTRAGEQPFRVSLWRQRKGERIRIVGAFAAEPTERIRPDPPPAADGAAEALDHARRVATALRPSLAAILTKAERLRAEAGDAESGVGREAADMLVAGWRLMRLADELLLTTGVAPGDLVRRALPCETDPAQLLRRIVRLNAERIGTLGAELQILSRKPGDRADGPGDRRVMVDETRLWSAVESVLWSLAQRGAARITLALVPADGGGLDIEIGAARTGTQRRDRSGDGIATGPVLALADLSELIAGAGATLDCQGDTISIRIPPARCIDAF